MVKRGVVPDVLTDQTSAHDALNGYVPNGMTLEEALAVARERSGRIHRALDAIDGACMSRRCSRCKRRARSLSITETTFARRRRRPASKTRSIFPDLFRNTSGRCFAKGKVRFAGSRLSGDPADIARTDQTRARTFPEERNSRALDEAGAGANSFPGFARAHLLARLRRTRRVRRGHERTGEARRDSKRRS